MKKQLEDFLTWVANETTFFHDKDVTVSQVVDAFLATNKIQISATFGEALRMARIKEAIELSQEGIADVEWQCLNCKKDTREKSWMGNCSQECLKQWMDKNNLISATVKLWP